VADTASELKQAKVAVAHLTKELAAQRASASGASESLQALQREHAALLAAVGAKKAALDALGFDESQEAELVARRAQLSADVARLSEQADALQSAVSHAPFQFSDPVPKFDRSKVKGLVADLVRVRDVAYATALEVAAGGKLYNVVVEDAATGKAVIEKGRLKKRYTFLPLDKIQANVVPDNVLRRAEQVAGGAENCALALSLVGYDDDVRQAMAFVFGNTLVCRDANSAKAVAFDASVRTKSVTLDGDQYDPAGTLTGGARTGAGQLLARLGDLNACRAALADARSSLAAVDAQLDTLRAGAARHMSSKAAWELAVRQAALLEARIAQNASHRAAEQLRQMQAELDAASASLSTLSAAEREWRRTCERLAGEASAATARRDAELAALDADRVAAKKALVSAKKQLEARQVRAARSSRVCVTARVQAAADAARLELEQVGVEASSLREQAAAAAVAVEAAVAREAESARELDAMLQRAAAVKAGVKQERERRRRAAAELAHLETKRAAVAAERDAKALECKALAHKQSRFAKDRDDAAAVVSALLARHPWIAAEKQ
jgi:structural maintenance of chromosome 2